MKNAVTYDPNHAVYPGRYVPYLKDDEVAAIVQRHYADTFPTPLVTILELSNAYKVEVVVPGLKREDFYLRANNNILSVSVIHLEDEVRITVPKRRNDDGYTCFDRTIILPENADAEFSSAEYKDGTLYLYTPKSEKPNLNLHATIVVY
jgi:HSP20 family protein